MSEAAGEWICAIFPLLKCSDPGLDFGPNYVSGQCQEMLGLSGVVWLKCEREPVHVKHTAHGALFLSAL